MTIAQSKPPAALPDHKQLPESDGSFVKNFQEHPQSLLLTSSIVQRLDQLHPDGQYAIGQDSGIYWKFTDPPERGVEAPDWLYIPNVPPLLDGERRRSYVLWKENVTPIIAIEFTSGDGSEERDDTPLVQNSSQKAGKFWVYEQAVKIPFYAIYEVEKASVTVYQLINSRYQLIPQNDRGHYPIPTMGVELGIWRGQYLNQTFPWLRWWDDDGNLLLTGDERSILLDERAKRSDERAKRSDERAKRSDEQLLLERQRANRSDEQLTLERQRADLLAAKLRELGINPDEI